MIPRLIIYKDDAGDFVVGAINRLAGTYFGRTPDRCLNAKIGEVFEPDTAAQVQESFEVVLKHKTSVTFQTALRVPESINVISFYISPHFDENKNIDYLDMIGQMDMADRSDTHRERDDAISLLTSVFEASEIGIIVTDDHGNIVRINNSFVRTYGWSKDDLVNTEFVTLITPDARDDVRDIHKQCLENLSHHSGELKIIRKDGTVANVLSTTATLELSQKRRYQVTTVMDITLRKRMEESLRMAKEQADAANRAKSMFLANMSHELRTPLNAIIGFSEMMINETFGALNNDKYADYLNDIRVSARHLLEIINEVLDMSKIEAGRLDLDEAEVNLTELIDSVTRMMASRAFGKKITLSTNIVEPLSHVQADERLLRQTLINLMTNAIKFSHNETDVKVSAKALQDNSIEIKVTDHGVGIPKDKLKQALEPFGQISDRAENAQDQGTGLGLPLAKAMVELHDGILQIDSTEGEGTTVMITLPSFRTLHDPKTASKMRIN